MNFVHFDFCDSVCAVPRERDIASIEELSNRCSMWKASARTNLRSRVDVGVAIGYRRKKWTYVVKKGSQRMSFEDLKKVNRRYLYVNSVELTTDTLRGGTKSSLGEIKELVKFTAAFVNLAEFTFNQYGSNIVKEFALFLPFFQNGSFRKIQIYKFRNWMTGFLSHHLKSGVVKELSVTSRKNASSLRPIVEEFLLTKQFDKAQIVCETTPLNVAFFEKLLAKPHEDLCNVRASFTGALDSLRTVNPGQQILVNTDEITWKRDDGVVIYVTKSEHSKVSIVMGKSRF